MLLNIIIENQIIISSKSCIIANKNDIRVYLSNALKLYTNLQMLQYIWFPQDFCRRKSFLWVFA